MAIPEITEAGPAAVGAIVGGGGAVWFARLMFKRMLTEFDKSLEMHRLEIKSLSTKMADLSTEVAVLKVLHAEYVNVRVENQKKISELSGDINAKTASVVAEIAGLRVDVFVAHERIRLIASGDNDLSKVQQPEKVRRR